MLSIKKCISCSILLNVVVQIKTLVELPIVEDKSIATAETAIRNTVNKIFATFRIQDVKHRPKLKQFSTIHNFFVSITMTDCNNLNAIIRLTRVKTINNNTQLFITQINEVLNEDDKSYEGNYTNNVYVTKYISMFIRRLKYLKEMYVSNRNTVINTNVLKYLDATEIPVVDFTEVNNTSDDPNSDGKTLADNEFWQSSGRRIYQGIRTNIKKFPFMASVLFFKKFQCAGSIIKDDIVITSASCLQLAWNNRFFRENPSFLSVQIGSDVYEGGGENIAVLEIYFYPKYNPRTLRNNIALMRLTRKIFFKKKHERVKKIDIDRNPSPMPINSPRITVIGWGSRDRSNVISGVFTNILSYAQLDYYPLADCQDHYSEDFVTEINFCAGSYSKGSGACNRDAGGPGVIGNTLFGVISFGSPICGAPDTPTVFTKLGFYHEWIESVMQQVVPTNHQRFTTTTPNPLLLMEFSKQTRPTIKIHPITEFMADTSAPTTTLNHLRITQDQGFQDFLETMFSKDPIKDDFDLFVNTNEDIKDSGTLGTTDKHKDTVAEEYKQKPKTKVTELKLILPTIPTKSYVNLDISSYEIKNDKDEGIDTATKSKSKVTVIENVKNNDKNLKEDIMSLIDNLDIDKILKPDKPGNVQKVIGAKSDEKVKNKIKEYVTVAISASEENLSISPQQQSVSNFFFLSKENKDKKDDVGGLSIQADDFRDLTFKGRPNINKTKYVDALLETALYELISLAFNEEDKRLRKGKHNT